MKRWIPLVLFFLFLFSSCGENSSSTQSFFAMDTVMQFTVYGEHAEEALSDITDIITLYDTSFSPTRADSELLRINGSGGGALSPLWTQILAQSLTYCASTGGAFDPVLGSLVDLWHVQKVPSSQDLIAALEKSGHDKLSVSSDLSTCRLSSGASLNLGGIVKGAASDAIYDKLVEHGVQSAVLSLGGNILAFGSNPDGTPWSIGIRDPDGSASDYLGTVSISDQFVVASGDYERYFEENGVRYHHILDPKTGYPVQNDLRSVVIVSKNATLADAYSTALFVMGSKQALDFWREQGLAEDAAFDVILILRDKKIIVTEGISSFRLNNEDYTYEVAYR